ncbi:hypothetical protein CTA2_5872 [Colletotrichum tanaceti]|uniref:Uncharacterized protein n=1 Tax=Colletotrichum tanaceti TaxID=1306861 RepID=A0A4U6X0L5_9PEZI|nr:hypothetical protein CTA2_5872 [Colletotrichum tanaceti]TKW48901.1 hypothetical protein CTA1_5757 [Colletotrichum tanaceti]
MLLDFGTNMVRIPRDFAILSFSLKLRQIQEQAGRGFEAAPLTNIAKGRQASKIARNSPKKSMGSTNNASKTMPSREPACQGPVYSKHSVRRSPLSGRMDLDRGYHQACPVRARVTLDPRDEAVVRQAVYSLSVSPSVPLAHKQRAADTGGHMQPGGDNWHLCLASLVCPLMARQSRDCAQGAMKKTTVTRGGRRWWR